jgi:molybdate transport system substrate-binding protein
VDRGPDGTNGGFSLPSLHYAQAETTSTVKTAMKWTGVILMLACALAVMPQVGAEEITVAAAADLNYALKDLAQQFTKSSGTQVKLSFGSSGNLFSQIQNGAPFDLFFSADSQYPQKLADAGLVEGSSIRTYAVGHLVLWVPNSLGLDPEKLKMDLLSDPKVRRIAIANPQHAPYGRAAMAALEHFELKDKVASKLVQGENISQAAQFVQSGNAQAGLIALSLALSPAMKDTGRYWALPSDSYPEMQQVAAIITASKHKTAAEAFLKFVTSPAGQAMLQQYGFRTSQP